MKNPISELLDQQDHLLFIHGGCHVFAKTLVETYPEEGYTLQQISVNDGYGVDQGYHIYASIAPFAVDAFGINREKDLLMWIVGKKSKENTKSPIPNVFPKSTNTAELFTISEANVTGLPRNRFGHLLEPAFIASVEGRAKTYLQASPERFKASLLFTGATLRNERI